MYAGIITDIRGCKLDMVFFLERLGIEAKRFGPSRDDKICAEQQAENQQQRRVQT